MRTLLVALLLAVLGAKAQADAGSTVLITALDGGVRLEKGLAGHAALEAFVRLNKGDRLALSANAKVVLVYLGSARQESWQGAGVLVVGEGLSELVSGKSQLEVRQLPAAIVRQINRTPVATADGRVGMVRLRALKSDSVIVALEREYQALKAQSAGDDLLPDVYLLAGLFEHGEYARIELELQRINQDFPNNASASSLKNHYQSAIAKLRGKKE